MIGDSILDPNVSKQGSGIFSRIVVSLDSDRIFIIIYALVLTLGYFSKLVSKARIYLEPASVVFNVSMVKVPSDLFKDVTIESSFSRVAYEKAPQDAETVLKVGIQRINSPYPTTQSILTSFGTKIQFFIESVHSSTTSTIISSV